MTRGRSSRSTAAAFTAVLAALGPACNGSSPPLPAPCTPGEARRCSCDSSAGEGMQYCGPTGGFETCRCEGGQGDAGGSDAGAGVTAADAGGPPPSSGRDATASGPDLGQLPPLDARPLPDGPAAAADRALPATDGRWAGDGPAPPGDAAMQSAPGGCVPSGMIASGKERLIDVFPVRDGIVVVRPDAITLVGRDRAIKKTLSAPRPITTATFDGTRLVTADAAMLNVHNAALEPEGTVLLTEACASSVMMDDGVFVCGPANDWDRVFYTYDVVQKKSIARAAKKYTYHGIPMRRIPGTRHFVTVTTSSSPSDFHLYRVEAGGSDVVFVNESPYHGDIAASEVYGFVGQPPTHLVNVGGILLRLFGDGCDSVRNSFTSGCFVKDGSLGTLWANQRFLSLANDAAGGLYGVVATMGSSYFDPVCKTGCEVQKIDVNQRRVIAQRQHLIAAKRILVSRPDPTCDMLVVAYEVATGSSSSSFDWTGYQVDLLDWGRP